MDDSIHDTEAVYREMNKVHSMVNVADMNIYAKLHMAKNFNKFPMIQIMLKSLKN